MNLIHRTSIIIPCYNEAQRLDRASFRAYLANDDSVRLLFVDDGSRDQTRDVLEKVCSGFERKASLLSLAENSGKAEAVRLGLLQALAEQNTELVGFWDADLATPLNTIGRFVEIFKDRPGIDMVFGSRVKLLGRHVKRDPRRHYMGRIFATLVSNVLQLPIYDTQCGAKLFRVSSGIQQVLSEPFISKWIFDVEILARYLELYRRNGQSLEQAVYEYPLESWEDVAGSKVRPSDFAVAMWDLLRIRSKYAKR